MDHKKVGTVRLGYYRSDGIYVEKDFRAELNDAVFAGNVSALNGTFRGKLTAQAVNAVKNINLGGHSVARSVAVHTPGQVNIGQNVWGTLGSANINLPAGDYGTIRIKAALYCYFWVTDLNHGSEHTRWSSIRVLVNGVSRYESKAAVHHLHSHSNNWGLEFILPAGVGVNTVTFQFYVPDVGYNIAMHFNNVRMRLDLVYR